MKDLRWMAVAISLVIMVITGMGCGDDIKPTAKKSSMMGEVMDSLTAALAENIEPAAATNEILAETLLAVDVSVEPSVFTDLMVVESTLYAANGDGMAVYDMASDEYSFVPTDAPINALTEFNGTLYAGGNGLFEIVDGGLVSVAIDLPGTVTELCGFDYRLVIGTDHGLIGKSVFGTEVLFDGITVTALAAEEGGLWVGTLGEGLYRWDSREFQKRFLRRDTSLFDFVNSLAFNHDHLYMGTSNGMYIYNGGTWREFGIEEGLPSLDVRDIDASGWVVHIATANGVASWFNNELDPVYKLGGIDATAVAKLGRWIFVGTDGEGLLQKLGPVVNPLAPAPVRDEEGSIAATSY